jgi:hypothetical protein
LIGKYPPGAAASTCTANVSCIKTLSEAYGSGEYIYSMSSHDGRHSLGDVDKFFNGIESLDPEPGGASDNHKYLSPSGTYIGDSTYIVSDYPGEWIKVKMPLAIYVGYIKLYGISTDAYGWSTRRPENYRVYGSNDDISWDMLMDTIGASYTQSQQEHSNSYVHTSAAIAPATAYKYVAICVNKIVGGNAAYSHKLQFDELEFYGNVEKLCDTGGKTCDGASQYPSVCNWPTNFTMTCLEVSDTYIPSGRVHSKLGPLSLSKSHISSNSCLGPMSGPSSTHPKAKDRGS